MTGYNDLLRQLYRQTINLSDDGRIEQTPAFQSLLAEGANAFVELQAEYQEQPTRAVMLLLKKIGEIE